MIKENHFAIVKKGKNSLHLNKAADTYCYIETTNKAYSDVRTDFQYLPQLRKIETINISSDSGNRILLYGQDQESTLLAVSYIAKYIASKGFSEVGEVDEEFQVNFDEAMEELELFTFDADELVDFDDLDLDFDNQQHTVSLQAHQIPFLSEDDFLSNFFVLKKNEKIQDVKEFILLDTPNNAYFHASETVIVDLNAARIAAWSLLLPELQHNIIFVTQDAHKFEDVYKQLMFTDHIERLSVTPVDEDYLYELFEQQCIEEGVPISVAFDFDWMYESLKRMKNGAISPIQDINMIAKRYIKHAKRTRKAISNEFSSQLLNFEFKKSAEDELQNLIGLQSAKDTVRKIVAKMHFNHKREQENLPTLSSNYVMAFIGNPGTAKTTFAKLFSNYLLEIGLLENDQFKVVTKKDLVGKYVGHTAPKIAALFEEVKGGVLFIDEAYSLYEGRGGTSFVEEAMAELVLQIEENPKTVVIFAGYPKEMRHFMELANAGLRSRITHIVPFADYSIEEMCLIYRSFATAAHFELQDEQEHFKLLREFIERIPAEQLYKEGNGRLMRKVFQRTLEEKIIEDSESNWIASDALQTVLNQLGVEFSY